MMLNIIKRRQSGSGKNVKGARSSIARMWRDRMQIMQLEEMHFNYFTASKSNCSRWFTR